MGYKQYRYRLVRWVPDASYWQEEYDVDRHDIVISEIGDDDIGFMVDHVLPKWCVQFPGVLYGIQEGDDVVVQAQYSRIGA